MGLLGKSVLFVLAVATGLGLLGHSFGPEPLELKGAHVLITGGSSGIGLEVAREVLARGAKVSIVARNPERLERAKTSLLQSHPSGAVVAISADVTRHEAASRAIGDAEVTHGPVDALITSAGTTLPGVFEELPVEEFERQMRVNYLGTAYSVRAVVPGMKRRKSGRVVMVASQAAQIGIFGYTAYSASKFALRGFAESLRMELAPHNVRVSVNYPPDTATPMLAGEQDFRPAETTLISADSKTFQPEEVASDLINGMVNGKFAIATGFDGFLLEMGSNLVNPISLTFPLEVIAAPVIRLVGGCMGAYFDWLCSDQLAQRDAAAKGTSGGGEHGEL